MLLTPPMTADSYMQKGRSATHGLGNVSKWTSGRGLESLLGPWLKGVLVFLADHALADQGVCRALAVVPSPFGRCMYVCGPYGVQHRSAGRNP